MSKKRIAVIINGGIGVGFGLEGVICLDEFAENIADEYDLTVFSIVKVNPAYQPKNFRLIGAPIDSKKSILFRLAYIFYKIVQMNWQNKFDIIHGFWAYPSGLLAVLSGNFLKSRTVVTFMGGEIANIPSIKYGLFQSGITKKLVLFTAKYADCIVGLSQHHTRKLKENLVTRQIETISFGVDLGKFPVRKKKLIPPYQFLYLGDINHVKDLPTLIKTFYIISQQVEATLDIVGNDTLNGKIKLLVTKLNLENKVFFHGRQFNHQLIYYLQNTHILLHTSLWESQAVVVNEAIASGLVVCGTQVGLIDDLGYKVTLNTSIGNPEKLAQLILELLKNPLKYEKLSNAGIAWSEGNSLPIQSGKYIRLYQRLLKTDFK